MRKSLANYAFIIGVGVLLFFNLIAYESYHEIYAMNYRYIFVVLTTMFVWVYFEKFMAQFDKAGGVKIGLKAVFSDKSLWLLIAINVLSSYLVLRAQTYLRTILALYAFTMALFMADKIKLSKRQIYIITAVIGVYFFIWTIKVHGYTINFAGQVLVGSFVMLMIMLELFRLDSQLVPGINRNTLILQILLYVWALIAISKYRCRSSFVSVVVFGGVFFAQKIRPFSKKVKLILLTMGLILIVVFPMLYVQLKLNGSMEEVTVFEKQVVSGRGNVYAFYLDMIKAQPFTGAGTIYVPNDTPFRAGLLDASNTFLQLAIPHGLIVAGLVYALIVVTLFRLVSITADCKMGTVLFAGIMAFGIVSTSESFMINFPFMMIYAAILYIMNSCEDEEKLEL